MATDEDVAEIVRQAEALDSVFLCDEDSQGRGCRVFTCTHCKHACRRRDDEGKLYYAQCDAAELKGLRLNQVHNSNIYIEKTNCTGGYRYLFYFGGLYQGLQAKLGARFFVVYRYYLR